MQVPALCFGELSSGSDSSSHRGYGVAYLHCAWLERGEKKKGGGELSLFTFWSSGTGCERCRPLVRHGDVIGSAEKCNSSSRGRAVIYCVYQRRRAVFCMSLCTLRRMHTPLSTCGRRALGPSRPAEPRNSISFGGVLIQLALSSSGTDYSTFGSHRPLPSPPLLVKKVHRRPLCLFHTIVLWWWDVWPNVSYLISVQRQGPVGRHI